MKIKIYLITILSIFLYSCEKDSGEANTSTKEEVLTCQSEIYMLDSTICSTIMSDYHYAFFTSESFELFTFFDTLLDINNDSIADFHFIDYFFYPADGYWFASNIIALGENKLLIKDVLEEGRNSYTLYNYGDTISQKESNENLFTERSLLYNLDSHPEIEGEIVRNDSVFYIGFVNDTLNGWIEVRYRPTPGWMYSYYVINKFGICSCTDQVLRAGM